MKLYSYQEKCLEAIEKCPSPTQLISMPTGTGKTITFLSACIRKNKRTLILVHRQELLEQTIEKALRLGIPREKLSCITSEGKEKLNHITIAMVPTLINHLHRYCKDDVEMMIVDEAHHSLAQSYIKIFNHFEILEKNKILLGFTATPLRGDGKTLGKIYKEQSFKMTLQEATQQGYICPVHGMRVEFKYNIENIESRAGDYDIQALDKIMNCESLNELIANRCSNLMRLPAIVFCSSVSHAENIKEKLVKLNRKAEVISYHNSKSECQEILTRLKENKIDFILNAVKLTEGFDHPPIQTIVLARPTRSPALYKQMIGRGLRLSPGKYDCLVMEFTANDPKMITWDQIDTDCSFQCYTPKELVGIEEGKKFYKCKFVNPDVKILDVRVSPFSFYECKIQRVVKYRKEFRYVPADNGFTLFHIIPITIRRTPKEIAFGHTMTCYQLLWKQQYKSFVCFSYGPLWNSPEGGWPIEDLEGQIKFYADHCLHDANNEDIANPVGRWYPSEEEPMSPRQKKFLGPLIKTNARKAEMMIEEKSLIKAINKFWINSPFPKAEQDASGANIDNRVFEI